MNFVMIEHLQQNTVKKVYLAKSYDFDLVSIDLSLHKQKTATAFLQALSH